MQMSSEASKQTIIPALQWPAGKVNRAYGYRTFSQPVAKNSVGTLLIIVPTSSNVIYQVSNLWLMVSFQFAEAKLAIGFA
jgi:hypothetical protein